MVMVTIANDTASGDRAVLHPDGMGQGGNHADVQARRVVAGHYELDLEAPLGSGGMALVFRGRDLRMRRVVALKTLRPEYRRDPETRARFRREARTMAFLRHPHVARVFDLYEDEDAPWVVLEYVPGQSLKELVRERGPLPLPEIAGILEQVADALGHLHDRGLVHLDVKPQNLILTPEGIVKLIDFGLAQQAGGPQETVGGLTFGTAAYLSPEQACGEVVDATTDVYALGCVVYELLTGQPPFGGDAVPDKHHVIRARLDRAPEPPSVIRPDLRLPSWVDRVVLKALARHPHDRYQDVRDFSRDFRAGIDGATTVSEATTIQLAPATAPGAFPLPESSSVADLAGFATGAAYRAVGRQLRRATALRRFLWRCVAVLLVANIVLAGLLFTTHGSVPGLVQGPATLAPGSLARVTTPEGLNIRSAPGYDAPAVRVVAAGWTLSIIGPAQQRDGDLWWPVSTVIEGERVEGFVWAGGIEPAANDGDAWMFDMLKRILDLA
jgi:tRNA A-37 threonylcarbamoyl transferase component Bud32